ncbi:methylthioadenosine nucleosidase /adenosylhomocysteine nucleosidase [Orbus hercynius]|uniref:5'-methylthioadenosine/S-adenosylhomocysteine nucleosidase n=1 Tax=Orbus hercynius TaxID=593135 RepID=A0A495RIB9_9GAMM|nr:5'-methylthioadenosine/adenosylhomocysteine nucleosidase [Orbus hercynius]RKS87014.1 methylthioadenosine nucleosidase /adenosylhomocysteine nucleosidase [Orbus hercynius]
MKIAIIAAMEEEVAILKSKIINCHVENILGFDFYLGQIEGCDVVLLQSGIGKVAAATGTTLLLSRFEVSAVINTGSAGGLDPRLKIGDIVVSNSTIYHDVDLTPFGYQPGQMAGCPITFNADISLKSLAKEVIAEQNINAVEGVITSGDAFINGENALTHIKTKFPDAIAVEMEATAIAHVCWLFSIPFIVVRAISDNGDKKSAISFEEFLPLSAKQSSLIVESMLKQLK